MPKTPAFKEDHLYKGVLYLADSPEMQAKGMCKFGETRGSVAVRERGHTGQTSDDRSHIFHTLGTLDSPSAESFAREKFREMGLLVHPERSSRKELLWRRDVEALKEVLGWAVRMAPVRVGKVLTENDQCQLTCADPAWACMLGYAVEINSQLRSLGHWMAQALLHPKIERRLAGMGLECSFKDLRSPEFTLDRLNPRLEVWLTSHGFRPEDLKDRQDGQYSRALSVVAV